MKKTAIIFSCLAILMFTASTVFARSPMTYQMNCHISNSDGTAKVLSLDFSTNEVSTKSANEGIKIFSLKPEAKWDIKTQNLNTYSGPEESQSSEVTNGEFATLNNPEGLTIAWMRLEYGSNSTLEIVIDTISSELPQNFATFAFNSEQSTAGSCSVSQKTID